MRFLEALLEVPERATTLELRALEILDLLCAAAYTTELPTGISLDEIDRTVSQMMLLDDEGKAVMMISAKMKSLPAVRSSGSLFI